MNIYVHAKLSWQEKIFPASTTPTSREHPALQTQLVGKTQHLSSWLTAIHSHIIYFPLCVSFTAACQDIQSGLADMSVG